jgi:deazaflavin-dependent oxidoreductase (nitroreductase family)
VSQPGRIPGPVTYDQANGAQRLIRRFASSGPGSWIFARVAHHLDRPVYRITRGRYTVGNLISGLPVVMLTTTGAKSGQPRTVPILGLPTDDGIAVIASNFGQYRHPGWYHNLRANPEAEVAVNGSRRRVRAVEADEQRRERIWREGLRIYPGFDQYAQRASHRRISVFVLEPR